MSLQRNLTSSLKETLDTTWAHPLFSYMYGSTHIYPLFFSLSMLQVGPLSKHHLMLDSKVSLVWYSTLVMKNVMSCRKGYKKLEMWLSGIRRNKHFQDSDGHHAGERLLAIEELMADGLNSLVEHFSALLGWWNPLIWLWIYTPRFHWEWRVRSGQTRSTMEADTNGKVSTLLLPDKQMRLATVDLVLLPSNLLKIAEYHCRQPKVCRQITNDQRSVQNKACIPMKILRTRLCHEILACICKCIVFSK